MPKQPLLREAFEAGQVDWTKAVLASRAIEQEPEREAYWLNAAQELNSRKLEAKVAGKTGAEVRRGRWIKMTEWEEAVYEAGLTALSSEGLDLEQGAALVPKAATGGRGVSGEHTIPDDGVGALDQHAATGAGRRVPEPVGDRETLEHDIGAGLDTITTC